MNRRGFLSGGSAAAVGAVIGAHSATTPGPAPVPVSAQRTMIIQLARAGLVFPLLLPAPGSTGGWRALSHLRAAQDRLEPGLLQLGAAARPGVGRLRAAERGMPDAELAGACEGASLLVRADLLGAGHAALLTGAGRLMATARPADRAALHSATTLAVRMAFPGAAHHRARLAASRWLGLLSAMHAQGTLRPAIRERGLW